MTPPKITNVNIAPLDSLHLENLLGMEVHQAAKQFRGTDLVLDVQTGELNRLLAGGKVETTSLEQEAAWIDLLRSSDANGDKSLDLEETQKLISANLAPEQAAAIEVEKFLGSIDDLMKMRYGPLAENMRAFGSETRFQPTLDAIRLYNEGIRLDELSLAHRTFAAKGLGKTAVNIVGFLPSLARNLWTESPALVGDAAAEGAAEGKYREREAVIDALEAAIAAGIESKESWALNGDLESALALLDEETRAVLEEELCATKLHGILTTEDPKERYNALYDFAVGERPGILGYGGGNSRMLGGWMESAWNLSGKRNNVFFAKTVLRFLSVKATTDDPAFNDELRAKAREAILDIDGDPLAGFVNLFSVGATNILGGLHLIDEPTEYRNWSDEAAMDGVGRAVDGALIIFASRRAFTFLGDATRLTRATTLGQTAQTWWKSATFSRPLGGSSLGKAAVAAEKEAEALGITATARWSSPSTWVDFALRPWNYLKKAGSAWLFKGLPPLSGDDLKLLRKTAPATPTRLDRLTHGILILSIAQHADTNLSPEFNPFEHGSNSYDPEADFERYPDPTLPDPALNP